MEGKDIQVESYVLQYNCWYYLTSVDQMALYVFENLDPNFPLDRHQYCFHIPLDCHQ